MPPRPDFDFARQGGDHDQILVGLLERKTADRLHAFVDANKASRRIRR
jgi:hypothetical protein